MREAVIASTARTGIGRVAEAVRAGLEAAEVAGGAALLELTRRLRALREVARATRATRAKLARAALSCGVKNGYTRGFLGGCFALFAVRPSGKAVSIRDAVSHVVETAANNPTNPAAPLALSSQ